MHNGQLLYEIVRAKKLYPSLSLIVPTERALPAKAANGVRVREAYKSCCAYIRKECDAAVAAKLEKKLQALVERYDDTHSAAGIAFFVNAEHECLVSLDEPCREYMHVGSLFALSEILHQLRAVLACDVLVLSEEKARLIQWRNSHGTELITPLVDAKGAPLQGFPLDAVAPTERKLEAVRAGDLDARYRTERLDTFMRLVIDELAKLHERQRVPLIVVAQKECFNRFSVLYKYPHNVLCVISGDHINASIDQLSHLVRPAILHARAEQEGRDIALFHDALNHHRQAAGLQFVWEMAVQGRVHQLFVEYGYVVPGRVDPENPYHLQQFAHEAPAGHENLIDLLLYEVLMHGGVVTVAPERSLQREGCVGAILRY